MQAVKTEIVRATDACANQAILLIPIKDSVYHSAVLHAAKEIAQNRILVSVTRAMNIVEQVDVYRNAQAVANMANVRHLKFARAVRVTYYRVRNVFQCVKGMY